MTQSVDLSSWFTVAWAFWILLFVLIEGIAIWRKSEGDTLTEHVRDWFATERNPNGPFRAWRRVILIAFLAWLAIHFLVPGFV